MWRDTDVAWEKLVPARVLEPDLAALLDRLNGKTVLITGAGGCIGSALARALAGVRLRALMLLDHSEQALYELQRDLECQKPQGSYALVLSDFADAALLPELLRENRPDLILHAAAFKHVPLMEANPFAAIRNNALSTYRLAKLAAEHNVPELLLISTDKAANPRSIMGASKRLAELAVLRWNGPRRRYFALRLANVLGSQGSVGPLFLEQIERGGPVTVTHPEVTRYFLTLAETVHHVFSAATTQGANGILLPKIGDAIPIRELAARLIASHHTNARDKAEIEFMGLRPGDKLNEDLISDEESLRQTAVSSLRQVVGRTPSQRELDETFQQLEAAVQRRDLAGLLDAVTTLIPNYKPSALLATLPRPEASATLVP